MLLNLHKKSWMDGLTLKDYNDHCKVNETTVEAMLKLAKNYNKVGMNMIISVYKNGYIICSRPSML